MPNLPVNTIRIFLAVLLGLIAGLVLIIALPVVTDNPFFVIAIPFICIFLLLMAVDIRIMMVILLFTRALLDQLLNVTRLDIMGQNIGAGGAINFLVICLAFFLILRDPKRLSGKTMFKWAGLFLAVCAIAITYSPEPGRAVRLFLNLASYLSMAVIPFFLINSAGDRDFWLKALIFSSFLPVLFADLHLLQGGTYASSSGMRIAGTFTHPNILAFYLVLMIAVTFSVVKGQKLFVTAGIKNVLRAHLINMLILLLFTKTRSAWISCWVMFFLYGVMKERKFVIISLCVPFLGLLSQDIMDRVRDLFHGTRLGVVQTKLNSFAWRLELWKSSLGWLRKRILTGYGLVSFRALSPHFFKLIDEGVDAHNTYLEILFETGIFGLMSYVAIFISFLKRLTSAARRQMAAMPAQTAVVYAYIIGYLIASFADNMPYYLAFSWYLWFFIGIMLRGEDVDE